MHFIGLPLDLDNDEIEEASALLQGLTSYLSSERCLRRVETAIIIDYVGKRRKILLNVETGLDTAKEIGDLTGLPAFGIYQNARMTFLADYLFALHSTGPEYNYLEGPALMPDGFHTRPLAEKMLAIGQGKKCIGEGSAGRFGPSVNDFNVLDHQNDSCVFWKPRLN